MEWYVLILCMAASVLVFCSSVRTCEGGQALGENFITWDDLNVEGYSGDSAGEQRRHGGGGKQIIVVSKYGAANSRTVQGAVNMVRDGNRQRVKILIKPAVYREKVTVPITKPYISFIGYGNTQPVISWGSKASDRDSNGKRVGTYNSSTVAIEADYFVANGVTFENTAPTAIPGVDGMQAVALRLTGDKAMISNCRILGSQDTLFDHYGRHYFLGCFIQGSIDFIFGIARSFYQGCTLQLTGQYGSIAASQRGSNNENSGFSFFQCKVYGSGIHDLGRAWGRYSRVIFSSCELNGGISPRGWSDMGDPSKTSTVWFGEFNCRGKGADRRRRVPWARSLTYREAKPFMSKEYIDGQQWLRL